VEVRREKEKIYWWKTILTGGIDWEMEDGERR
jgi:hypothetical protein